jgi:clan AA aspartic protease (TIGR02281 family)
MSRSWLLLGVLLIGLGSLGASAADLNAAGKAAYARGDYGKAEQLFAQAIARAPADPLLHYHRGVALTRLSRWREAAQAYQTALRLNPTSALATSIREALGTVAGFAESPALNRRDADLPSVSLQRAGGGWLAEVVVNESRRARFLVDTGASICVISPELARELGMAPAPGAPPIHLQTLSGRTSGSPVTISSLRVGEAEMHDVAAVIHDTGPGMDGILGNTFLGRFTVTVDPERRVLNLKPR